MKLLAEISDKTLGLSDFETLNRSYELKKGARAILRKEDGTICVQHLVNDQVHKLPGGGVEPGESLEEALVRELKEEVGCTAQIGDLLGVVIEYREKHNLLQIGYCFVADFEQIVSDPNLEADEIESGLTVLWVTPEEAIAKMETDIPNTYQGPFIRERELVFLKEYMRA